MTTSRAGAALVAALALVWGSNFLWIKVALDGLSPVQLTFLRMVAGALVLAVDRRHRRHRWPGPPSGTDLGGQLACLAAAASYGVSFVYIARYLAPRRQSPFALAYGQTLAATILLVPALLAAGRQAVDREGATTASTVIYLLPIVAVALGATVLDEPIMAGMIAGTIVVLIGVALARRTRPDVKAETAKL